MRSLALRDRDIYAHGGNLVIAENMDAVIVGCETIMRTLVGEMIYQVDEGMPYIDAIFNRPDMLRFEAAARIAIMSVPGVIRIDSLAVSRADDTLYYTAEIVSQYGLIEITNARL